MRGPLPASASIAIFAAALVDCARHPPPPPPREPPARVLSVGLEHVALRANAYVELHAWLAAAGRGSAEPPAGLEGAASAYGRTLAEDDADELLAETTRALSACSDDRCAREALARTPLSRAFSGSLEPFAARWWTERATFVRGAIELTRGAFTVETDALVLRIAEDLAIDWPHEAVPVDVVADAPPPGRDALVHVVLPARGTCFAKVDGGERVQNARILDCVFARAAQALRARSLLGIALEKELGPVQGKRAWDLVVIHAVAATITGWEPKHLSTMRRSAMTAEPRMAAWLAEHWKARASGEGVDAFAARCSEAWRQSRAPATRPP